MESWYAIEGSSYPLGVVYIPGEGAYNFALYSKNATNVKLLLFVEEVYEKPVLTFELDLSKHKSQRVWHCRLKRSELAGARFYAYQVRCCTDRRCLLCIIDPQKLLLDPYAREIFFPPDFSRSAASRPGTNIGKAPLGYIVPNHNGFDWEGDHIVPHQHDLIIYEMHVRGYSRNPNSGLTKTDRGTFKGVTEKISYLKELGITAVELLPVHQYDPQSGDYWGYMPLNFFSPHRNYAAEQVPSGAITEFKTMVRELHKAGIEVILDVVYNYTTEEGLSGPTYHLKGIDSSTYYLVQDDPKDPFFNFCGTGNTLRTDHQAGQRMIMDSLRYWVKEMHMNGFRFDLASIFTRRSDGSVGAAPIFSDIATDPDLAHTRLIAEPWDAQGLYQLGRDFPGNTWLQWNSGFRDDVRRFVKGEPSMVGALTQRLYVSDHLFPDDLLHAIHPYQSVNYGTSHDGFTLYDLVSYNEKYNIANGQNNQDGASANYSCIVAGREMKMCRKRYWNCVRNSRRTCSSYSCCRMDHPCLWRVMSLCIRRGGNNTPYNQDNQTTWLDWSRLEHMQEHFAFVKKAIGFRKAHPSLARSRFWRADVKWYGANGGVDFGSSSHTLGFFLSGKAMGDRDLYVMINSHWESREFTFMEPGPWIRVVDTSLKPPLDFIEEEQEEVRHSHYTVIPRSVVVFVQ